MVVGAGQGCSWYILKPEGTVGDVGVGEIV